MEPSAALFVVPRRNSRARRTSFVPVIVFAILAIVGAIAPPVLLAAETPVETQRNPAVVFVVIMLLAGSAAAGLFFASPLRRWFLRSPASRAGAAEAALGANQHAARSTVATHAWPAPGRAAPDEHVRPTFASAEPTYVGEGQSFDTRAVAYDPRIRYAQPPQAQMTQPTQAAAPPAVFPAQRPPQTPVQTESPMARPAQPRPMTPWSTGAPQPDANWDPARRRPS